MCLFRGRAVPTRASARSARFTTGRPVSVKNSLKVTADSRCHSRAVEGAAPQPRAKAQRRLQQGAGAQSPLLSATPGCLLRPCHYECADSSMILNRSNVKLTVRYADE